MAAQSVDDWVAENVAPELQPVMARLRALMRALAPAAEEKVSYKMPVYAGRSMIFAYLTAARAHLTLSFTSGAYFEDKPGLLRGSAKHARYLRYKKLADINETVLRYYVKQAVADDRKRAARPEK